MDILKKGQKWNWQQQPMHIVKMLISIEKVNSQVDHLT